MTTSFNSRIIILALSLMTIFAAPAVAQEGVKFFKGTLEEAQKKAKSEGKLVFVDAYTTWCAPCKWMNANVFPDPNVADYFNQNFVNLKIDMEKGEGPALARKYRVVAYPSMFFLKSDGSVVRREVGMKDAKKMLEIGKLAMSER